MAFLLLILVPPNYELAGGIQLIMKTFIHQEDIVEKRPKAPFMVEVQIKGAYKEHFKC